MPESANTETLPGWMADVDRRLVALERGPALANHPVEMLWRNTTGMFITASTTFVPAWDTIFAVITHDALKVGVQIGADTGSTVEARLYWQGPHVASGVRTVTGDGIGHTVEWDWAPTDFPLYIGALGVTNISLQIRRSAGAGNVFAGAPGPTFLAYSVDIGATSDGL